MTEERRGMETSVKITLIIVGGILALAVLAGLGIWALAEWADTAGETISVDGTATVKAMPDIVTIYFNVETNGLTSKEANDNNSIIVEKLVDNLVALGITEEDIVTENYQIYEDCTWTEDEGRVCSGWIASHGVKIELNSSRTDLIGNIVDAGVDAGAIVNYISFELSQEKQNLYKAQALKMAGEDARTKANAIVEGVGKEIDDIESISTQNFGYSPWRVYSMAADVSMAESAGAAKLAATNIQPGEKEVSGSVTVVFSIK